MVDVRTVAAAVLGLGLGALCVVYPEAVIRVQTVGRMPHDRTGDYGEDASAPDRWRWIVRLVGAVALLAGGYFGATVLGSL